MGKVTYIEDYKANLELERIRGNMLLGAAMVGLTPQQFNDMVLEYIQQPTKERE